MNIDLKINIIDTAMDIDGNTIGGEYGIFSMMLSPFYSTENDILNTFMDSPTEEYINKIREIIFDSSIVADNTITRFMTDNLVMSKEEIFMLKRQFVICLSSYEFSKTLHRDYLSAIKKSKFFGDIKISLEIQNDPTFILKIMDDAKECYEGIKESLVNISGIGISPFIKGRTNLCSRISNREWYTRKGNNTPSVPIAATKITGFCRKYKIGRA